MQLPMKSHKQPSEVPQVDNIHIGAALVSEERDPHQVQQIYPQSLVPQPLHLIIHTILIK